MKIKKAFLLVLFLSLIMISLAGPDIKRPSRYPSDEVNILSVQMPVASVNLYQEDMDVIYIPQRPEPPLWEEPDSRIARNSPLLIIVLMVCLFLARHAISHQEIARRLSLTFFAGVLLMPVAMIIYLIGAKIVAAVVGVAGALSLLFVFLEVVMEMAKAAFQ